MLLGIPSDVNRFFHAVCSDASKPIRNALAPMVLAFLLAPHYRRLKTIAQRHRGNGIGTGPVYGFFGRPGRRNVDSSPTFVVCVFHFGLEILTLLAEGHVKREIGKRLNITYNTVVSHVAHIYEKLNVQNSPAAVAQAFRLGLLPRHDDA